MKSLTITVLETVEQTKARFHELHGRNCEDEKKLFINWYVQTHKAPLNVLIADLSDYYLHISEDRIIRYLSNE